MRQLTALIIAFMAIALVPAVVADAGSSEPSDAEMLRNDVLLKATAWRTKSAEATLKKAADLELTQPYLTAAAVIMATYSLGQNENFVLKALSILEKQVENDPSDPVAEFYRGEVLRWLDRKEEARAAWTKAKDKAAALVAEDAHDGEAQYYLGAALVRMNKPAAARKALKKADRADFDPVMVDFQTGLAYMLENNWKAAKKSFDEVSELDPRYAHLYFYRGIVSNKLGRKDQLLSDLDQFVKLAPNSPEAKQAQAILASVR